MKNTMPHDKQVEVIEISTGMFKAYLHANHVPFEVETDEGIRTEYRCDTVLTAPMSFASEESALAFFTEHHDELMEAILAREAVGRAKSEAEIAQAYLYSTDYMVVKCAELGLSMEAEYPDEFARREDSRRIIREYRRMVL